jgi:hypothetical protein
VRTRPPAAHYNGAEKFAQNARNTREHEEGAQSQQEQPVRGSFKITSTPISACPASLATACHAVRV